VLRCTAETDYLVVEMGARGVGHIAELCRIAPPDVAAVLNVGTAHLGEFGSREAIARAKGEIVEALPPAERGGVAVLNADDPLVAAMAQRIADRQDFSLDPGPDHCFGVAGDSLVDRCIGTDPGEEVTRVGGGVELARVSDIPVPGPHNVANALAAAALARALHSATGGRLAVHPQHVRDGLRGFDPGAHRIAQVETVDGVGYVDDSKATNAHAAAASLQSFASVVWVAGGLAKGATFDELVSGAAARLRGVVLIGRDRALIAEALARHAPEIPVVEVTGTDTGRMQVAAVMDDVVRAAAALARPGDTVLLAPACASMDMFRDYAERGDAFADAVRRLPGVRPTP
jgi:UDP-N-acetylmuramoylalanine--D-glutamate ligase